VRGTICIVTSGPLCTNPRVVKEADALSDAGFAVRVICSQHLAWVANWDEQLIGSRRWRSRAVRWDGSSWRSQLLFWSSGLRRRAFMLLAEHVSFEAGIAEHAYVRLYRELAREAAAEHADLYIAHTPQALPAAALAARRRGALLAFDSEDLHLGEVREDQRDALPSRLLGFLEQRYITRCSYVSAASENIAQALATHYGISPPLAVHNTFPWADRDKLDHQRRDREGEQPSLYWYSQIVGLDRGIQDAIRAAGIVGRPLQLHLRGDVSREVRGELERLARSQAPSLRLFFHDKLPPDQLLSRCAEHDIGLALERGERLNYELTVTNKVFSYLLAGLCVAASDTLGQRCVLAQTPGAGFLYPIGNHELLAQGLRELLAADGRLTEAKRAALEAARTRWNWELESRRLVELVASRLSRRATEQVRA
jgi:glycosyltransferase involved in cell wall biosynthesis